MANQIKYKVGFDVDNSSLKSLKASLQELQKITAGDLLGKNTSQSITKVSKDLLEIKRQAENVEKALGQAYNTKLNTVNMQNFNRILKESGSSINQVYQAFSMAGAKGEAAFRNLASQMLNVNTQAKGTHAILDKMATTLGNTLKWNIASTAINGMTRSVEQAWGYVKSLDGSLNDIRIVTGKSSDEMARFAEQANSAAKSLGKTTTDYTKASLIYAQQGLNDEEIAARAAITLKAANVTGQSTDDVSEQLTAVWNGYKVTADQAELYVDRLAAVAATTASDLEELSTGMSKVASAAAAMGVGEDQLAAQLSTIISVTKQAPQSVGTALRTVYARISDIKAGIDEDGVTLGNYSGKMKELGFNVLDAAGNLRDMGEVMEQIGGRWQDLTREQQISLAQTMAGQRQYNNLLALFGNFEAYNQALNTARNAAGTLQQQQDIYMESTAAHLNALKASVEDVYDSFMNRDSLDSVNDLIDALSDGATVIAGFVDSLGGGMNILSSLGALGVTVFSNQIANGIMTSVNNFNLMKQRAAEVQQAIETIDEMQAMENLDPNTSAILDKRKQLLQSKDVLGSQQFGQVQQLLNDLTQAQNELDILKDKLATIYKLSGATNASDLADPQFFEKLTKNLENQGKQFEKLKQQSQQFKEGLEYLKQEDLSDGNIGLDDLKQDLKEVTEYAQNYAKKLSETANEGGYKKHLRLIDDWKKKIEELNEQLSQTGNNFNTQEIIKKLENALRAFQKAESQMSSANRKAREDASQDPKRFARSVEGMQEDVPRVETDVQGKSGKVDDELGKVKLAERIKQYTELAGSIGMVASSIQQISNIGRIFNDKDLNAGQKFLQIATNLGMSLPMLVGSLTNINKTFKLFGTAQDIVAVKSAKNISILGSQVVAIKSVEMAGNKAGIAMTFFGRTLTLSGVGAAILGITALAAAIAIAASAWQEYNRKKIEADKTTIDEQNKKQQQIQKNKQLANSIEELNNKYKSGEITRTELKSGIQDLINEYGLEGQQVEKLTKNYDNLASSLQTFRKEQAGQALASSIHEKETAKDAMLRQARQGAGSGIIGKKYTINFTGLDTTKEVVDQLDKIGAISENGFGISLSMDYDQKHLLQLYDTLVAIRKEMQLTGMQDTKGYDSINDWINKEKESVEQYRAAIDDINNNATFLQGSTQNFDNIENFNQYREQRQQLIDALNNNQNIKSEDLEGLADTYLSKYFSDLFSQFDEGITKIEQYKEKFGEMPKYIDDLIKGLSEQDFNKFLELNPDLIKNWKQLEYVLQHINELKSKNTTQIGDIQARNKENLDNFKKYDEVRQSVSQGKEIKEKDYQALAPQLQQFFTYAGDGMWKLANDAKGFYDAIDDLKMQGFQDTIQAIQNEIQTLSQVKQGLAEGKFSSADLEQSAIQENGAGFGVSTVNNDLLDRQIKYLNAAVTKGSEEEAILKEIQSHNVRTIQDAQQIYELISKIGDKTKGADQNLANLNDSLKQQYQQMYDAMFPTDKDVDQKKLQALSDQLQKLAENSEILSKDLESNGRAAEDVAQGLLRFSDATKDVADNYDDWMKALSSDSLGDQAEAIAGLRDAYADLLDFPEDAFSDQFLTSADNLNLLKEAANGSTEAYDQLMQAAQQDIATQVGLDTTAFDDAFNALMDQYYQGQNLDDMQIGASLDDAGFLQGLTDMVNAANMSAEQATAYLASMGVDAEVIEQDNEAEESSEAMEYETEVTGHQQVSKGDQVLTRSGPFMVQTPVQQRVTGWDQKVKAIPKKDVAKKQNKSFALKVTSAKKSSGGGFKYSNAPGKKSPSKKGGGGGGGKGGGGGSGSKPDTSKKDAKKPLKSEKDPYHDINIKLRDINDQLEKMEKHQERLWGKQAFDNLNKQNKLLEDQLDALKEKNKIQRQELSKQRKNLQGRGVTFDADGNISNYMSILQQQENKVQAMYDQYNKWVKKYNESTDADYKKGISEAMSNYDKQIKEEEEKLKELKSDIDKYDKTQEEIQKNLDEQDETNQKIIENNIKKFRMQVEIRLDMGKAERDWNEFRRNVLEKTDVLKGTEFDNIFGDASQNFSDLFSYFNVHGSMGTVEKLTNQLHDTLEQLQQIDKTGTSAIYGDNKAQAMEDLQSDLDELMDQMKDIEGLIDDIDQAYLDTIDDIQDQFDKQIEDYEYVQQLLENDMDLLTLLYGDKNYEAMQKYYDQMYQNNLKQLDSLRQQREFWKQEWDAAIARGDTNAAEKFEQNYKNAISNINSVIQDSIENLQDSYSNAIEKIFDALDNKLTNGKGTEYLKQSWDLMNKNADEYLDTVNSAFAIQDTQRKYQNALNDTKNIKNQQALKKLMDEQLNILKNKEKLTQYDIDRAQKLLEVEQARIALEDARSAKTSMRLKRDSQGNYSYEYYADEEGIGEAEENYANAQNDLYNFDLDKTKQTTNEILSAWQEFKDKYKEIMLDVSLSDQERHEKLKLLQDQYGEYFNLKTEQLANVRLNLMDSAFKDLASLYNTDVENYNGMADAEKDILMGNIVPTWKNGVVEMAQIMAGEGGLLPVCQDAFDDLDETTKEYQDDLQELAVAAGVDFDDIQNGIDDTANDLSDLIETNDELISRMSDELLAITLLKDQAHRLMEEYQNVKDAAIDAVNQIHNYIQAQQAQAADYIANQKSMADAQSNAYAQVADAYVAAINKMRAAINAASSSSGGGGSPGGGGNPGGTSPGSNNNSDNYSVVSNPYGASGTYGVQDSSGGYVEISGNLGYLKEKYGFATGGYTGNWNSDEGRIAVLHEKELVLNKEDTTNMLNAVKIIRSLNDNVFGKAYDINASLTNGKTQSNDNKETIEQDVHITATFPNVNTKKEIEEAFGELANRAAQRVLKR